MIQTFIFFDLETTGLIKKDSMPRIIEMCLIAVSEKNIRNGMNSSRSVLQKLILPINPNMKISKKIEAITGITNESLTEAPPFNSGICALVKDFIKLQKGPICFVAYNGNTFDYPIFLWELENINKVLSEDVLCIDMLPLARDFFSRQENPVRPIHNAQDSAMNSTSNSCDENEIAAQEQHNHKELWCRDAMVTETKRRKLDFTSSKPDNFKLSTIYENLCHKNPNNAHTAEGDCLSMIECAIKFGDFFLEWAEQKAVPLISYTK